MKKIIIATLLLVIPIISFAQKDDKMLDEKWMTSVSTFLKRLQDEKSLNADESIFKFINQIKISDIKYVNYGYEYTTSFEGEEVIEEDDYSNGYGYIYEYIEEPKKEKKEEILNTTYKLSVSRFRIEVGYKQNFIKAYIMNKDGSQEALMGSRSVCDVYSIDRKYKIKYETTLTGNQ